MISNLRSQLDEQGALDRIDEVMAELPRVRAEMGYPPLVTPTSQIIGIQAVINVLGGKRYGRVTEETRAYVKGLYGRPPAPLDAEIAKAILDGAEPISGRPADLLPPGLPAAAAALPAKFQRSEEDILSYALFPEVALGYFNHISNPKSESQNLKSEISNPKSEISNPSQTSTNVVASPFAGTFHRRPAPDKEPWVADGASCAKGDTVCAIEAMKLLNTIAAPCDCTAVRFLVADGATVAKGTPLFEF